MPDQFESFGHEQPDARRVGEIASGVRTSLEPVRPVPSRKVTVIAVLAGFAVFAIVAALPFGYWGFANLGALGRVVYSLVLLAMAALCALALDQELIPGSKRRVAPGVLLGAMFAALCLLVLILFPRFATDHFVARGVPCLRLGSICAAVYGALLAIWIRRGLALSRVRTGAVAGALAGLAGFAVLALHCARFDAPHILVWHLGAFVIALTCGTLLGSFYRRS